MVFRLMAYCSSPFFIYGEYRNNVKNKHWTTFPAPSVNTVSETVVLSACIKLKSLDPDSRQITKAASPSLPAATRSVLIEVLPSVR